MKTKNLPTTRKKLMKLFLLALGICFINSAWAFKASFTYTTGSSGLVNCTSTSTGTSPNTIYTWNAGDGSPVVNGPAVRTFNHTYAYNGSYTIVLYIWDSTGNPFDSASTTVTISNSGTCSLNPQPSFTMGAAGLVNFSSAGSTGVGVGATYQWWFGDGNSSTNANPSNTYVNNGYYYPSLTITNGYGCTSTVYDTVNITTGTGNPPCNLNASFTVNYGVNGHMSFTSTTTGINGYAYYTWNPGDGSGSTNYAPTTYSHTYTANGNYTVMLTVYADSTTCISTDTLQINVTNITTPCTLSANYTYTVGAAGLVSFTSTSTGTNANTLYYWNAGDGTPTVHGTTPTFNHTYVYQGNYYPWLTVRDTGSAYCVDSTYQYVSQYTADSNECHLVAHFTYTVGVNGHVSFTNTSSTINTNLNSYWNFGDGGNDFTNSNTDKHIYTANGTYTVTLTASADSSLCLDSTYTVITISNITTPCTLSASFTVSNDTTKGMVYVSSTSTGTYGGTQYTWKSDSSATILGTGSSTNLTFPSNGSYNVWLIIENTGSAYCIDSVMETINISNQDSLHASFTSTNYGDTVGNYLYIFTSTSTGTNGVTYYRWDAGDTTGADSGIGMTTYSHYYHNTGIHTVTLSLWFTQYPGIQHHRSTGVNDRYDFTTFSMPIDIEPAGVATISNPNADFKLYPNPNNGAFRVAITGIENAQNAELQITNLLGEVVYQTQTHSSNGMIQQDVNLQNISGGTYFVRIITADRVYNTKTVITR